MTAICIKHKTAVVNAVMSLKDNRHPFGSMRGMAEKAHQRLNTVQTISSREASKGTWQPVHAGISIGYTISVELRS
jgi:hypothetical protein